MRRRREEEPKEKILDVDASMQGTLSFKDPVNLRINGKFEGKLQTKGSLTIGEHVVGVGLSSGRSYEFGEEGPEVVSPNLGGNVTINISAVDAVSFVDLCERNPGAILGPLTTALKYRTGGINNLIRSTT